jgi:hypothetical protein
MCTTATTKSVCTLHLGADMTRREMPSEQIVALFEWQSGYGLHHAGIKSIRGPSSPLAEVRRALANRTKSCQRLLWMNSQHSC